MTWWYRYEARGIQQWILDSNKLRDLAGGSALIEDLQDVARRHAQAAGAHVLMGAAGGMTATFATRDSLAQFASFWPVVVDRTAPGLRVIQAWVDDTALPSPGLTPVDALYRHLQARRNEPRVSHPEAGPWMKRAARSGLPAVQPPPHLVHHGTRRSAWDRPTVAKELVYQQKHDLLAHKVGIGPEAKLGDDLERWPEGPVAVVHIDGSGVGQRLQGLRGDPGLLQAFSAALSKATVEATRAAVGQVCHRRVGGVVPLRPIVLGGDDLTVLLAASDAVGFVQTWLETFERATEARKGDLGGRGLYAGAGAALVHRSFPFSDAYAVAEQACRRAKRACVDAAGEPAGSAFVFDRITTALAEGSGSGWPWRREALPLLQSLVDLVGRMARGPVRTWLGLVGRGAEAREERDALWQRMREVARDKDEGLPAELDRVLAQVADASGVAINHGVTEDHQTPLRDAAILVQVRRRGEH